jgi:hypothetical protein
VKQLDKIENAIHSICDKKEEFIDKKIEEAKKIQADYKRKLQEDIFNNENEIDKIKEETKELIKTIELNAETKIRNLRSANDILINRKNKL